jgi:hypothetical protein
MTNYHKKRKRQNGRQGGSHSARQQSYWQGYFDGQSKLIGRLIDGGLLPSVNFDLPVKDEKNE